MCKSFRSIRKIRKSFTLIIGNLLEVERGSYILLGVLFLETIGRIVVRGYKRA